MKTHHQLWHCHQVQILSVVMFLCQLLHLQLCYRRLTLLLSSRQTGPVQAGRAGVAQKVGGVRKVGFPRTSGAQIVGEETVGAKTRSGTEMTEKVESFNGAKMIKLNGKTRMSPQDAGPAQIQELKQNPVKPKKLLESVATTPDTVAANLSLIAAAEAAAGGLIGQHSSSWLWTGCREPSGSSLR